MPRPRRFGSAVRFEGCSQTQLLLGRSRRTTLKTRLSELSRGTQTSSEFPDSLTSIRNLARRNLQSGRGWQGIAPVVAPIGSVGWCLESRVRAGPIESRYSTKIAKSAQPAHALDRFFGSSLMPSSAVGTSRVARGSFGRGLLKIDVAVAVASLASPVVMATRRVALAEALVDSGSAANRTNGLGNRCFVCFRRRVASSPVRLVGFVAHAAIVPGAGEFSALFLRA